MKFIKIFEAFEPSGGWVKCDPDTYEFIKDFFIEMIDEGFEVEIEKLNTLGGIRYNIDCIKKWKIQEHTHSHDKSWYEKNILDYGRKFYDASITLESNTESKINRLEFRESPNHPNYQDVHTLSSSNCVYSVMIVCTEPIRIS